MKYCHILKSSCCVLCFVWSGLMTRIDGQDFRTDVLLLSVHPLLNQSLLHTHNYPNLVIVGLNQIYEMWVQSLAWENPLEESMATHYNILAWRNPWTEEPARLQSTGLKRDTTEAISCNQ